MARLRAAGCVFAEDEARLLIGSAPDPERLAEMVAERVRGVPLEHVVGWAEFCGIRIAIGPGVFVPRHRTELLVRLAATAIQDGRALVDLACGSGAIAAAVADRVPGLSVHAADIEPAAVEVARRNLAPIGGHVYAGDLFDALPESLRGRVDVLVANVPYVPSGAVGLLPPEARDYEPRRALDGGADGLDVLRRVAAGAPGWLRPGGTLLSEIGVDQIDPAKAALSSAGLAPDVVSDDDLDATVILGRR
ncbi:methylase [Asanoa ishikariensis]|uniref:peptide chain release factor N(5)-glutamine methyltransferase n=1 Tax=Asanoa ishikariensis TaxID=137265 RepID=A0A1H3N4H5_9ACTN|nr:methylase [Asanoa ishikariensis]SDY83610.1 release factor glutamine methyltransferase [Asanoa ishikariensis]